MLRAGVLRMPINSDGFFISTERLKSQAHSHRTMAAAYLNVAKPETQERAEQLAQIELSKANDIEREYFA
tara:strand:- start:462 stop:671 length:210 start_codon:yes stop_codon:yes gene_type:complete